MWLLLHGFTGAAQSWEAVESRAELEGPVCAPFLVGHSAAGGGATSFGEEVERIATIAASAPEPRYLCGYSMGSRVALGMIAHKPALFRAAVLIGVHPGLEDETDRAARRALDAQRAAVLRREGLEAFVDAWEREPLFETQRHQPAATLQRQRELRLGHDAEGLATSLDVLGLGRMPHLVGVLSTLTTPVVLMAGERDPKFKAIARTLATRVRHVEIVSGAGHNLLLEAPGAVASTLAKVQRGDYG